MGLEVIFILSVLFFLISICLWYKFGKDEKIIPDTTMTLPDTLNSLDVARIFKGKVDERDVISLVISLAKKGYLKIMETKKDSFLYNKGFKIIKLREYNGKDINEKMIFRSLFVLKNEISDEELPDTLFNTIKDIKNRENRKKDIEMVNSSLPSLLILIMIFITAIVMFCVLFMAVNIEDMFLVRGEKEVVFIIIYIFVVWIVTCAMGESNIRRTWLSLIFIALFPITGIISLGIASGLKYQIVTAFVLILIIGMGCCIKFMPQRTRYGKELVAKIMGFKFYFENLLSKDFKENSLDISSYFYYNFENAYVLGILEGFIDKFENDLLEKPDWYESFRKEFDVKHFYRFVNDDFVNEIIGSSKLQKQVDFWLGMYKM